MKKKIIIIIPIIKQERMSVHTPASVCSPLVKSVVLIVSSSNIGFFTKNDLGILYVEILKNFLSFNNTT